jgi:hypothetical protein
MASAFAIVPLAQEKPVVRSDDSVEWQRACTLDVEVNTTLLVDQQISKQVGSCGAVPRIDALQVAKNIRAIRFGYEPLNVAIIETLIIPIRVQVPYLLDILLKLWRQKLGCKRLINDARHSGLFWKMRDARPVPSHGKLVG